MLSWLLASWARRVPDLRRAAIMRPAEVASCPGNHIRHKRAAQWSVAFPSLKGQDRDSLPTEPRVPANQLQQICACLGQPVAGNPTQYMMERAFAHQGLDWRYLTLEVLPEHLGDAVRGLRALGFRGGNITKPHKCEVIQYLDGTSEAAGLMGAVNCIDRDGEKLIGENTDGKGFVQSLRGVTDPAGKRIVILGAG